MCSALRPGGTPPTIRWCRVAAVLVLLFAVVPPMAAGAATLSMEDGPRRILLDTASLLTHPAAADIAVARDPGYGGMPRRYRAVPVQALLPGPPAAPGAMVEATATDGFATQIPIELLRRSDGDAARAWLAIEPPDAPWPSLPGRQASAGPFYLVWERPERSGISREYWPFGLADLRLVPPPAERWPRLVVDPSLPTGHAARAGQDAFAANCLPCHRLNGAGSSDMGPDLNVPMSPTEYFQPAALRRYLRDPGALRSWPQRLMQGFSPEQLPDRDLDAIVAYLDHMAQRRP